MKIAITGHTSGIGLSLFNKFKEQGHYVIGFSRRTGTDIGQKNICKEIVEAVNGFDVFVNNAYHPIGQNRLLSYILSSWTSGTVVSISSDIVSVPYIKFDDSPADQEYISSKIVNNHIIASYDGPIKVLNVKPYIVRTNFHLGQYNSKFLENALEPDQVADLIIKEFKNDFKNKELIIGLGTNK